MLAVHSTNKVLAASWRMRQGMCSPIPKPNPNFNLQGMVTRVVFCHRGKKNVLKKHIFLKFPSVLTSMFCTWELAWAEWRQYFFPFIETYTYEPCLNQQLWLMGHILRVHIPSKYCSCVRLGEEAIKQTDTLIGLVKCIHHTGQWGHTWGQIGDVRSCTYSNVRHAVLIFLIQLVLVYN